VTTGYCAGRGGTGPRPAEDGGANGPVQARGVQRRRLRRRDHAARARSDRGRARAWSPGRSALRQMAGLPGLPDQLLHDRHHLGQPSRAGQVHHQGGPHAAVRQPAAAAVRRPDPVRHRDRGGLLPGQRPGCPAGRGPLQRGVPRHVGRLRRDPRVDAARRPGVRAAAARTALAGPAAIRRRRPVLRARPGDRALQRRGLVRGDRARGRVLHPGEHPGLPGHRVLRR